MLTTKALRAGFKGRDKWISDGAVRGSGALWARIGQGGTSLYFRYTDAAGKKRALAVGAYDEVGAKGLTLPEAREKTKALSKLYQSGVRDLHEHLARERDAAERARRAEEEAAREALEDAKRGTLRQLLAAYVAHLERQGKQAAKDVKSIFAVHVTKAAPELLDRKAAELSVDDFVGIIGRLVEAGKGRTADKLRSYLRAAYQLAVESKTNPAAPLALRAYGITVNPIASIGALSQFNKARDRVLSAPELGAFLRRIEALQAGARRDALQLSLLLGGQRPMQLLRLKASEVDLAAATLTLYDGKGSRSQPRAHVLPLVKDAAAILKRRVEALKEGEPVFSTDGEHAMRVETLGAEVGDIVATMLKADPPEARESFQLRDIRRTCETMLASLGVSSDIRAQIQSHGLGGVQQRHYDRHSYALEKKQALEKWARHLAALKRGEKAEVVPLRRQARDGKRRGAAGVAHDA